MTLRTRRACAWLVFAAIVFVVAAFATLVMAAAIVAPRVALALVIGAWLLAYAVSERDPHQRKRRQGREP